MSTQSYDEPRDQEQAEAPASQPEAELVELGRISETQGGILGAKYDTAVGWQYY